MKFIEYVAAAALCLCTTPVLAQGMGISELRGGLAVDDVELFSHAPIWAVPHLETIKLSNLDTASFDVIFTSPDIDAFKWIGSPRPVLGADLNIRHESMIHASLNWHIPVFNSGFFIEPELGAAVHNGTLTGAVAPMRDLGCRALFYWSVNLGYQIDPHWDILATEQHASQDGICGWTNNQGLNYESIRIGYKF
jgi:hypothetical protein